jgi:hypothetical protein
VRSIRLGIALLGLVALTAACGGGGSHPTTSTADNIGGTAPDTGPLAWPAPPADQVAQLTTAAGLQLEHHETLVHHVHAHLDVFIDGVHRNVPAGICIVITDPAVHHAKADGQPAYGGISNCDEPCISPLHTHDITGILHTESATSQDNTLGQFFKEWNVRLDDNCVADFCTPATTIAVYVNGRVHPLQGVGAIPLTDLTEFTIVIGQPPARIPNTANFNKA